MNDNPNWLINIVIALSLFIFSVSATAGLAEKLTGVWEGKGRQSDGSEWSIRFTADGNQFKIEYPSFPCRGTWKLLSETETSATFYETIEVEPIGGACVDEGTVKIDQTGTDKLRYEYWEKSKEHSSAWGELTRVSGQPQPLTYYIDSKIGWQNTNLKLKKNQQFAIDYVSGKWTVDYRYFPYVGLKGYPKNIDSLIYQGCKYNASWSYAELLGKVGENGKLLRLNHEGVYTAPQDGTLFLSIHDDDRCLVDNDGILTIRAPLHITAKNDPHMAGYATTGSQTNPIVYKNVIATWKVPEVVSCDGTNSASATWAGIADKFPNSSLVQIGTTSNCGLGIGGTQKNYWAFWQVFNKGNTEGPQRIYTLPIFPGNEVKVQVKSYGFGEYGIDIWNLTLSALPNSHWSKVVSGDNSPQATAVAECLQEEPPFGGDNYRLTHFSSVTITCTANSLPIGSAGDIIRKVESPKMKTGALNASGVGGTFTIDWVSP